MVMTMMITRYRLWLYSAQFDNVFHVNVPSPHSTWNTYCENLVKAVARIVDQKINHGSLAFGNLSQIWPVYNHGNQKQVSLIVK